MAADTRKMLERIGVGMLWALFHPAQADEAAALLPDLLAERGGRILSRLTGLPIEIERGRDDRDE